MRTPKQNQNAQKEWCNLTLLQKSENNDRQKKCIQTHALSIVVWNFNAPKKKMKKGKSKNMASIVYVCSIELQVFIVLTTLDYGEDARKKQNRKKRSKQEYACNGEHGYVWSTHEYDKDTWKKKLKKGQRKNTTSIVYTCCKCFVLSTHEYGEQAW